MSFLFVPSWVVVVFLLLLLDHHFLPVLHLILVFSFFRQTNLHHPRLPIQSSIEKKIKQSLNEVDKH